MPFDLIQLTFFVRAVGFPTFGVVRVFNVRAKTDLVRLRSACIFRCFCHDTSFQWRGTETTTLVQVRHKVTREGTVGNPTAEG